MLLWILFLYLFKKPYELVSRLDYLMACFTVLMNTTPFSSLETVFSFMNDLCFVPLHSTDNFQRKYSHKNYVTTVKKSLGSHYIIWYTPGTHPPFKKNQNI
jgi:hypothetical protein